MKIICKYKDYYDYFSNIYKDDTITFDRRDCIPLSNIDLYNIYKKYTYNKYILLQVGYTNWLIDLFNIKTEYSKENVLLSVDFDIKLVEKWKDYNHCYKCRFGNVSSNFTIQNLVSKKWNDDVVYNVKHNDYDLKDFYDIITFNDRKEEFKFTTIPIFNETKICSIVDAFELYQSFEEYFSHLKDEIRVDTMSDKEKVESHGFDKDYSFRSKK